PERVKKVEVQVENILSDLSKINIALEKLPNLAHLEKITESLQKITGILSRLVDLEGEGAAHAPVGSGGKEYVS
ncbi:hypothetical protein IMZ68_06015, partial [Candidatus Bathyarchaeota archaeon]|nr:hypothetical protein [Candidatus Bathyarchaeota archaeon]